MILIMVKDGEMKMQNTTSCSSVRVVALCAWLMMTMTTEDDDNDIWIQIQKLVTKFSINSFAQI